MMVGSRTRLAGRSVIAKILVLTLICCLCLSSELGGWIPIIRTTPTPAVPSTWCLHHDQTIAIVTYSPDHVIVHCRLLLAEQQSNTDKIQLLYHFSRVMPVQNVSFPHMVSIIQDCSSLDTAETPISDHHQEHDNIVSLASLTVGILPGTLWCGVDDTAGGDWSKLGILRSLDKCCRAHDLCPTKVKPFQSRHGLLNIAPYTKTHCDCDDQFYNCLKRVNSSQSRAVGHLFFNVLSIKCIEAQRKQKCISGESSQCLDYDYQAVFSVINTKRRF